MNLLSKVKLSVRNRIIASHTVAILDRSNFYSTKTAGTGQKTVKSTKARTKKSSDSPLPSSMGIKEEIGASTVWPKPREIPYQPKVSNFVNLVGFVKTPVQFEVTTNGKHSAAIMISQENSGEKDPFSVAVVFEGDLAQSVACHVKENDCVFVSGQLSGEALKFSVGENLQKLHVVAENLNFVEGYVKSFHPRKIGYCFSNVKVENSGAGKIEAIETVVNDDKKALEHAKSKPFSAIKDDWATSGSIVSKPRQIDDKGGERSDKEKDGSNLWGDLVNNTMQWWDYRDLKANGLVKDRFPDFKHKGSGHGLWIDSAPKWALDVLGKLAFDVKVINGTQTSVSEVNIERRKGGKGGVDSWRDLVENPSGWWDNRLDKRNPRAPDFKHKMTGEVLWLGDSPDWASSRLPPLKDGQNNVDGKSNPQLI